MVWLNRSCRDVSLAVLGASTGPRVLCAWPTPVNPWAHAGIKICQGVTTLQWWNIHMHFSSPCLTLSFLIHGNDRILIHCGKHLYCLLTLSSLTCGNNQLRSHYLSRIVPSYILNYVYSKSNFGKNHSLH